LYLIFQSISEKHVIGYINSRSVANNERQIVA